MIKSLVQRLRSLVERPTSEYEYRLCWGNDRRAQGPLELRRNKRTGMVEWRYNGSGWSAGDVPGDVAVLFSRAALEKGGEG